MNTAKLLLFLLYFSLSFHSCKEPGGGKKGADNSGDEFPRNQTFYIAGDQWGDPNTFNPLTDWPAFPIKGKTNLMYEPLMVFNSLKGEMQPWLAKKLIQTNDVISVVMDSRARWSDGKPLKAADVVYSYEVAKEFKSVFYNYVWDLISKITVEEIEDPDGGGAKAEQVNFFVNKQERNNPLSILDQLQAIRIVPKHAIQALLEKHNNDFSAFQKEKLDDNPVVSGPYTLHSFSSEKIVLQRRDDYWGNAARFQGELPKPKYIIHPIYKSNDHFSIALQKGNLDVSSTFIPRIWMKAKHNVRTWFNKEPYFVPACIPMFYFNVTRPPLHDKKFRRAMAFALSHKNIRELAVSGYTPEVKPGLILPFGMESEYFSAEDAARYGATFNPDKAKALLKEAGYTSVFNNDGTLSHMTDAKGKKVPTLYIKCPAGWSDWEAMVKIAVKDMRAAGINVREGFVDAGLYFQAKPLGDFDLLLHKPEPEVTPSKPWSRLDKVMSSRNWAPEGEKMWENEGRYNNPKGKNYNPEVDRLLKTIPRITDKAEKIKAYRALNIIFMKDQPTLPLAYLPEQFYEFSLTNWANFATEANPYAPPQPPFYGAGTTMLWSLEAVK